MLKNVKEFNPFRILLLIVVLTGVAGAIYAAMETYTITDQKITIGKKDPSEVNIVIKAGAPLITKGKKDHAVEWNKADLIAEEKEIQNFKEKRSGAIVEGASASLPQAESAIVNALVPAAAVVATGPKALILYDHRPTEAYGKLGMAYAIMLRNLLGHFNASVTLLPINEYQGGEVYANDVTFYLGSYYGNPVAPLFLADLKAPPSPPAPLPKVVWFKYNLDQLTAWGDQSSVFAQQFGFFFNGIQGLNVTPTASNPTPGFFDTVLYKNKSFVKYYAYNAGTVFADPDAGKTTITNTAVAKTWVTIRNTKTAVEMPYGVQSSNPNNNFWYFADIPFSYIGPRDRYLVFADILHDILGVNHAEQHRAMIRLEDMSANTDPVTMKTLSDYLKKRKIPFSMAVIPHYKDSLGYFNGNVPQEIALKDACDLKTAVNYALGKGGVVLQHGMTHQYDTIKNPNSGVSGDDFEFWDLTDKDGNPATYDPVNAPIAGLNAVALINAGKTELTASSPATDTCPASAGYAPFTWETPHYQASPAAYRAAAQIYSTAYERAVYYTSEVPDLDPANPARDIAAGQFFPYVIEEDYYGRRVLPENLGNIEYNICPIDPFSCMAYTWNDLYLNAQYNWVVRDGFASFFFHPFWMESFPRQFKVNGYSDLQKLITGISGLGYQWIGANSLITP